MIPLSLTKLMSLAPLMDKRLEDLSVDTVQGLLHSFGSNVIVNEELLAAGLALLAGDNIHSVSDMIKSPESLSTLSGALARGLGVTKPQDEVLQIPVDEETKEIEPRIVYTASPGWRLN